MPPNEKLTNKFKRNVQFDMQLALSVMERIGEEQKETLRNIAEESWDKDLNNCHQFGLNIRVPEVFYKLRAVRRPGDLFNLLERKARGDINTLEKFKKAVEKDATLYLKLAKSGDVQAYTKHLLKGIALDGVEYLGSQPIHGVSVNSPMIFAIKEMPKGEEMDFHWYAMCRENDQICWASKFFNKDVQVFEDIKDVIFHAMANGYTGKLGFFDRPRIMPFEREFGHANQPSKPQISPP